MKLPVMLLPLVVVVVVNRLLTGSVCCGPTSEGRPNGGVTLDPTAEYLSEAGLTLERTTDQSRDVTAALEDISGPLSTEATTVLIDHPTKLETTAVVHSSHQHGASSPDSDVRGEGAETQVNPSPAPLVDAVTIDQVVTKLARFYETTIHSASASSTEELVKSIAEIQEVLLTMKQSVIDVSHRIDLMQESSQSALSIRFQTMQQSMGHLSNRIDALTGRFKHIDKSLEARDESQGALSVRLNAMQDLQVELSSRLDTVQEVQTLLVNRLDTLQDSHAALSSRLDRVQQVQTTLSSGVDATREAQIVLSTRLNAMLQSSRSAPGGGADSCDRLDLIQSAVGRIPWRILGDPCRDDADCSQIVPEAVCGSSRRCVCPDSHRQRSDTDCRRNSGLSEGCTEVADCQVITARAVCMSGLCACPARHRHLNISSECRFNAGLSEECTENADCQVITARAVCTSGVCACPARHQHRNISSECRFNAGLSEECTEHADCQVITARAVCMSGLCACPARHRHLNISSECRFNAGLSEECTEDADCQVRQPLAVCMRNFCACPIGYWHLNGTDECRQSVSKGGQCAYEMDCSSHDPSSSCINRICACSVKEHGGYEYRLTGGDTCNRGTVELRRVGGSWGLVCDDLWDALDAGVLCRSLGFQSGVAYVKSKFGIGTRFYMDNVKCTGSESNLLSCPYRGWGTHDCGASEVAGVACE